MPTHDERREMGFVSAGNSLSVTIPNEWRNLDGIERHDERGNRVRVKVTHLSGGRYLIQVKRVVTSGALEIHEVTPTGLEDSSAPTEDMHLVKAGPRCLSVTIPNEWTHADGYKERDRVLVSRLGKGAYLIESAPVAKVVPVVPRHRRKVADGPERKRVNGR